jgi:sigma-B regulation protein RsbU (phosphoserine phosphatase)
MGTAGTMDILIVGKDPSSLSALDSDLKQLSHTVFVADGEEKALRILRNRKDLRMVFIDSSLGEDRGVSFCKKAKAASSQRYIYVVIVCEPHEKEEVSRCLDLGGDDCLSRPFTASTLQVRLKTGERIIHLNERLRDAHEVMQIDLVSGREAQESMIPVSFPDIPGMEIAARFIPSAFVSGDIYNIFRLDERHVGLYSVDVSGHGVAAALFSVGISQKLNSHLQPSSVLKEPISTAPFYRINMPDHVLSLLDEDDMLGKYGRFFTMVYCVIDLVEKRLHFCRAGHNRPLLIRADGSSRYLNGGGPPIGLGLSRSHKELQSLSLEEGDAFILFSDGINEAFSQGGESGYGLDRIKDLLTARRNKGLSASFDSLLEDLKTFHGSEDFNDDISIIGFRWGGI